MGDLQPVRHLHLFSTFSYRYSIFLALQKLIHAGFIVGRRKPRYLSVKLSDCAELSEQSLLSRQAQVSPGEYHVKWTTHPSLLLTL